jgi:CheY-like chemotaxis protein
LERPKLVRPSSLLCVDDDADLLKVHKRVLEMSGYSVITTTSGDEALALLVGGAKIHLVILDYLMPGMNGDALARKLREYHAELPLVVLSAVSELPESLVAIVDAIIQKGSDPEVLLSTVARVLAKPRQNRAAESAQWTVLCVDDEDAELKMRTALFQSAGYRALGAKSANEAIEMFRTSDVDAVIMDYFLSGSTATGTGLAEQMKRIRPTTAILMLSGYGALPGEAIVVDRWMSKSHLDPGALVVEVQRLIERRTSLQNHDQSQ